MTPPSLGQKQPSIVLRQTLHAITRTTARAALASAAFLLMAQTGRGQTTSTINFDTAGNWTQAGTTALGSYGNHTYSESNWSFQGTNIIRNTTTVQDSFAGALGTYSWRLRDAAGSRFAATFNSSATISAFGFAVRRWDNSPDPSYTIEYSTNSGTNWTSTGTTINNAYLGSSDWKTYTFSLPSATAVTSGQFMVRVTNSTGERLMIDNFQWTTGVATTPTISTTGTPSALSTTYGTASDATSFSVSGVDMSAGVLVTPPTGFEVSQSADSGFGATTTVGAAGTIASTTVYVRLAANAAAGSPSGNVVLSSLGASNVNVAVSGTVAQKELTITGLSASNKTYDGGTSASVTGTPAYSGLANGESASVTGSVTWAFATAAAGSGKSLSRTGSYNAPSANYTVTQPTLTADITPAALTITATNVNKVIGQALTGGAGSTAFTSSGLVDSETIGSVTISYGTGAAAEDAAGTYEDQVTPSAATGGTFTASNYDITYATGDIIVSAGASAPTVTTSAATSVGANTATLNGNVSADGGAEVTARGFVSSTTDATPELGESGVTQSASASGGTGLIDAALSSLSANTTHYFQAYATNSAGTTYGGVQSFTTLKTEPASHVTGFAAGTITTSNIPATWTAAAADGYLLLVSSSSVNAPADGTAVTNDTNVADGSGAVNLAGDAASYSSFTGFAAGTTYTFAIYPYNNSGSNIDYKTASAPSFQAVLLVADPSSAPTFASVTATGFTVNWSAVTGAASYRLDLATDSGFTSFASGYENLSVSGTSRAVTGLAANTAYHVRVRAANASGTSGNSPSASQTTSQLAAPTTEAASDVTYDSFTANWNAVDGATGYRVDVTTVTSPTTTDLIISEYVEGSSNNKYLEIYNGTGADVSLSDYEVRCFSNGASTASSTQLLSNLPGNPTTLASGQTILLSHPQAALTLPAGVTAYAAGTTTPTFNSIFAYNGDDALALYKISTASYVDIFGVIGTDPGTAWTDGSHSTLDKTLRRKLSVTGGVTTNPASFATLVSEWDVYNQNTVSDLGNHSGIGFVAGYENADAGNNTSLELSDLASSTEYRYVVRATSANSTSANSDTRTVTTAAPPTISSSGSLSALSTTYGTASDTTSFTVSGAQLEAGIAITPPAGFEVSTTSDFSANVGDLAAAITVGTSGTLESTTVYVRLKSTAAAGDYSGNIALTSTNATTSNVATVSSTVAKKELTITGLSAANKDFDGNTTVSVTGTPEYSGLVNGESFAVTGTVSWAFANATVGTAKPLTRTGSYNAPSDNYTVTQPSLSANITAVVPGAPTIDEITPGNGQLTVAFTAPAFNGGASITDYRYSLNDGDDYTSAATTSSPIIITGLANDQTYDVKLRAVNSAGAGTASSTVQATPSAPSEPTLFASIDTLTAALTTTYGTPSSSASFVVSGDALVGDITVSAPTGLQVSTNNSTFASSVELAPTDGTVGNTTVYVRLAATAAVSGTYNSVAVTIASTDATGKTVSTTASGNSVTAKALTITGLSASNKTYDGGTSAGVSGTAAYSGLANGETHSVTDSITWSFQDKHVGTAKALVASGSYTAPNGNYTISSQPSLSADITAKGLSVSGATASNKAYDGTTAATITGASLVGVVEGDTVTVGGGGSFANANAGTGIAVTAALSLGGADAGNYSLTQPEGLTANITKATQTITFGALAAKAVGEAPFALTATSSSGLTVTYSSSVPSIASVDGSTVTLVAGGTTVITASQSGDDNYEPAAPVQQTLLVSTALFSENLGTPATTTSITNYANGTAPATFQNKGTLSYGNGAQATSSDIRSTSASVTTDYAGASGGGNVFFSSSTANGSIGFSIEGINAAAYKNLSLSYSYRKTSSTVLPGFSVDYWDGAVWQTVANTSADLFSQAANASIKWYVARTLTLPSGASINGLKLRFVKSGSTEIRIDDIRLSGVPKIVPSITTAPTASSITYGQTLGDSTLSGGAASVAGTFAFTSPTTVPNAGTANQSVTFTPTDTAVYLAATVNVSVTINAAAISEESITLSRDGDSFTATAAGVSGFSISYSGRNGTSYGPSATAPTAAGFYTATATSSDPNYTGTKSENYILSGPIAAADSVTKPADGSEIKIPLATLLANDSRLDAQGSTLTNGLSITGVTSGEGNSATISGAFVLFVPSEASPETFTYTV
ncbi:MAG: hypothetical protein FJ385_05090, partial [Verrucomicrobia bacterium]|nr:hypothetical protein [Verrucomicrobiota bacterium]